jgi:putative Mg2+ transporter-C (MgtC) family protein
MKIHLALMAAAIIAGTAALPAQRTLRLAYSGRAAALRLRGGASRGSTDALVGLVSTGVAEQLLLSRNLVVAAALGACIGVERGWAGRPAGIRTMSLVSMGAALFTGVGRAGYDDGARVAAQVASGVGFIGAGVIRARSEASLQKREQKGDYLKGLTTAAAIWLTAGVGVACGSGYAIVATSATVMTVLILCMHRLLYPKSFAATHSPAP